MDEIEKNFRSFLEQETTVKHIESVARSLSKQFKDHDEQDLAQIVFQCLLEKKDVWPKILETASPWFFIKKIVGNRLRDTLLSSEAESPALYFRKRIVDCLRTSEKFRTFEHRKGKQMIMCYALKSSDDLKPTHLPENEIQETPFNDQFTHPKISVINTGKRIVEMAASFLDFWENRDGKNVALPIDSLWLWIISNINISDVFAEHESSFENQLIQPNISDGEIDIGFDPKNIGYLKTTEYIPEKDTDIIVKKIAESLSDREKTCLLMRLEGKKLEDIAVAVGLQKASGISYIYKNIIEKIRSIIESSGYPIDTDSSEDFEKDGAFFVFLKEALKKL